MSPPRASDADHLQRLRPWMLAAGVAEPSTLVLVRGPDAWIGGLLNTRAAPQPPHAPLPARLLPEGILPGYVGVVLQWPPPPPPEVPEIPAVPEATEATDRDEREVLFALRRAIERLRAAGIFVRRFVVTGEPTDTALDHARLVATCLGHRVVHHPVPDGRARGDAILHAIERNKAAPVSQVVRAMAGPRSEGTLVRPDRAAHHKLAPAYQAFMQNAS